MERCGRQAMFTKTSNFAKNLYFPFPKKRLTLPLLKNEPV